MSRMWRTNNDPVYSVGDIIRYGDGPSALMQVKEVRVGYAGDKARYYGTQCCGGNVGAYHTECERARNDINTWHEHAKWRV